MTNALAVKQDNIMEQVLIVGDLAKLTPTQRAEYYSAVCKSVGLNPLTRPFQYIVLNGKLTLYANRAAADQLRKNNGVSINPPHIEYLDDVIVVTVTATDKDNRTDTDLGVVSIGRLQGDAKANAIMKAITKAKRRVTLSICGLGWLDETEVETIPSAKYVEVTDDGEILEQPQRKPAPAVDVDEINSELFGDDIGTGGNTSEPAPIGDYADLRAGLEELAQPTVGDVVAAVNQTGLYNGGHHTLNATKLFDGFEGKPEPTPRTRLSKKGVLALFDWLIERKINAED